MRWIVLVAVLWCSAVTAKEPTTIVDPDTTVRLPKELVVQTGCVERLLRATTLRPLRKDSGVACCSRCNLPWSATTNHVTWYWERAQRQLPAMSPAQVTRKGMSAICEDCFSELKPKARWSYYLDRCRENKTPPAEMEQIKAAVLEGK